MRESSGSTPDRRQTPRTKLVEIAYIGMGPENGGLVLDVSDGGLSFHAVAPVKRDEPIRFLLSLRGHSRIEGAGEVVWANEMRTICGLRFTSLSAGAREHLNNWTNQSRMPAAAREKAVPSAPPPEPPRKEKSPASLADQSDTSAEPVFAIPPAAEVYLSGPTARNLWGGQLFLWIVFVLVGTMVVGSAFLFGVHIGRSDLRFAARMDASQEPQANPQTPAPADVPDSSVATDASSAPTNAPAVSGGAASVPNGTPFAPPLATSIPGATTTDPNASLVNASKTDGTPANSTQTPGEEGGAAVASDRHTEQALQAGKSELAAALASLRGAKGIRDSSKAARLLWAAVANDNSTAEVVLADLYLRGDGVPKNCEQGRVLLLAASKSGDAQAKEKLGELKTNGCP